MPNPETIIQNEIRLAATEHGARLFRNNVGILKDARGNRVVYGLCPGSSDLVGWVSRYITTEDVGQRLALFTAVEVKTPAGRLTAKQRNFLDAVQRAGGLAGVARARDDLAHILSTNGSDRDV